MGCGLDEVVSEGVRRHHRSRSPAGGPNLVVDRRDVAFDGADAQVEVAGDLLVAFAAGDEETRRRRFRWAVV